jgi:methionyl-tRNA synthetase
MLLAAGLSLPKRIFAHGWWTVDGEKMSKSRGNVVDPHLMIEKYGLDRFRYFIMREVSFGLDGDFSEKSLVERTNSDLSDNFGNLVHRTLSMAWKYFNGKVPKPDDSTEPEWKELMKEVLKNLAYYMDKFAFAQALESIWKLVHYCNRYIEKKAPWVLNKDQDKRKELNQVMYLLLDSCRILALMTYPFIPSTAVQLWDQLGFKIPLTSMTLDQEVIWNQNPSLFELEKPVPLFPRIL